VFFVAWDFVFEEGSFLHCFPFQLFTKGVLFKTFATIETIYYIESDAVILSCGKCLRGFGGFSENLIHNWGLVFFAEGEWMPKETELPFCEKCRHPIDDCKCACPYCGLTCGCDCCTGYGKSTGG
jgi:hypothetical protein